ncbi:MAG: integral rane sensor signal transduction histidine kinase [Conexibacter sp.]|nr:integral rane sensor signal transduction histidine kinase [Conexibacter sp.]
MTSEDAELAGGTADALRRGGSAAGIPAAGQQHVSQRTRARIAAIAATALATAIVVLAVTAGSDVLAAPVANGVYRAVAIGSWVAAGLLTWKLRPQSPLGALFVASGFVFAATTLLASSDPALFTLGRIAWALLVLVLIYVLLVFPHGTLEGRAARSTFGAAVGATVLLWTPLVLGGRDLPIGAVLTRCSGSCPQNPFRVGELGHAANVALADAAALATSATLLAVAAVVLLHLRAVDGLPRQALLPVFACVLTWVLAVGASNLMRTVGGDEPVALAIGWVGVTAGVGVPYAMLLGQLRGRMFARGALRAALPGIARHDDEGQDVRSVLADVLGDPSLELRFWAPAVAAYVDERGRPAALRDLGGRAVTEIHSGEAPVAAIVHAETLEEAPGLVRAAGESALLALENAGLEARLRASAKELRESRARIVAAGSAERRRIERDLHDGAQNRLVGVRVKLGLAADRAAALDAEELHHTLEQLGGEVQEALDSVRTIAHGLYPPLLASHGLGEALAAEAERATGSVRVVAGAVGRSAADVEAAVYFVCLEAIQNASKHGGPAAAVTVRLRRDGARLAFSVADDGAGFDRRAVPPGAGLTNARDRIAAVGGEADVGSAPGRGTTVSGTVPWPARVAPD